MIKSWEKLQWYIARKLNELGIKARPTKASGASTELGDVLNSIFLIECKQRTTKNVTINIKVWEKLKSELPINSRRLLMLALENKDKKKFIVMEAEEFFYMLQTRSKNEEKG